MGVSAEGFEIAKAGIGVLAEAFPLETVQAILAATGREESGSDCCLHR